MREVNVQEVAVVENRGYHVLHHLVGDGRKGEKLELLRDQVPENAS